MLFKRKQRGFMLLEMLLVIIILLGITIWWVKQQNVANQQKVSERLKQQTISLISAVINDYYQGTKNTTQNYPWPAKKIQHEIINDPGRSKDGKYYTCAKVTDITEINVLLNKRDFYTPFGDSYKICVSGANTSLKTNKRIYIKAKINDSNLTIAQNTASYFSHGEVTYNTSKNNYEYKVYIDQPAGVQAIDKNAVHSIVVASPGDTITAPDNNNSNSGKPDVLNKDQSLKNCVNDDNLRIYTSVMNCTSIKGKSATPNNPNPSPNQGMLPIEACETYATINNNGPVGRSWIVHMRVLTPLGWVSDDATKGDKGFERTNDARIQVIVKCAS